jgi:hypothetical protein
MARRRDVMVDQIQIWEHDPLSNRLTSVDRPRIDQTPFKFFFSPPPLDPDPDPSTPNFRYWNAAAALRRGTDFWGRAVGLDKQWFCGPVLNIRLDVGDNWNSGYDRQALNFDRGEVDGGNFIYASNSADIVCHELGHAMLDIVKEDLWSSTYQEVAAFRESFGDMSAILCKLQVPAFRDAIWNEENGRFNKSSRLSRLAEQFGRGLHAAVPEDADADCLRNAYNHFHYVPPGDLNTIGPSSVLTSRPHSFSRVFTGAMFETLDGLLALNALATSDRLHDITCELRDIMIAAVRSAPIEPQYYASVAANIILAARAKQEAYGNVFGEAFVNRSILSEAAAHAVLAADIPIEWA